MLQAACELFLGKTEEEIKKIALETLEGHQRAIMGSMTVEVGIHFHLQFLQLRFSYYIVQNCRRFTEIVKSSANKCFKWQVVIWSTWE